MTIVSIGEILWDVIGEKEHLVGAPFNFAVHAARLGHEVLFGSGVGDDARGRRTIEQAAHLGIATSHIKTVPGFPTGVAKVEIDVAAMMARKDKVVKELTGGVAFLFKKNKVTHVKGFGAILKPGE